MLHQQPGRQAGNTSRYYDNMSIPTQNKKKLLFFNFFSFAFSETCSETRLTNTWWKNKILELKNETWTRTCVKWLIVTTCSKTKATTSTKCSFNVVCWLGKYGKSM